MWFLLEYPCSKSHVPRASVHQCPGTALVPRRIPVKLKWQKQRWEPPPQVLCICLSLCPLLQLGPCHSFLSCLTSCFSFLSCLTSNLSSDLPSGGVLSLATSTWELVLVAIFSCSAPVVVSWTPNLGRSFRDTFWGPISLAEGHFDLCCPSDMPRASSPGTWGL